MRRSTLLAISLAVAACTSPVTISGDGPRVATSRAEVGQAFDLRVGEEATVGETGVRIRFDGVSQDSRCPTGVQCVWSGDAEVALRITTAAGPTNLVLHTNVDPRTANAGGHLIRLEGLRPYPAEGASIPRGEYIATLIVTAP